MQEVVCWCCEHFVLLNELEILGNKLTNGKCQYKNLKCYSENKVCEEFILRSGLHTKKIIPEICKNYKDKK